MTLIPYKYEAGIILATKCPNKTHYVFDKMEMNSHPIVGSYYCLKQCEYFVAHLKEDRMVRCAYPEVQNVV
jgi:hypothetical protein